MRARFTFPIRALAGLTFLAAACEDDVSPTDNGIDADGSVDGSSEGTDGAPTDGVVVIDATAEDAWIRFDLDTGAVVTDDSWDLRFQRYQVLTNGGASGEGGVIAALAAGADFDALTKAPEGGWMVDAPDSDDEGTEPDSVFLTDGSWYAYDPVKHVLTPRDQVYVVRTTEGAYVKVALQAYYDDAGTAGHVAMAFAAVDSPEVDPILVPGTDGTDGTDCDALDCGSDEGTDALTDGTDGTDASDATDGTVVEPPAGTKLIATSATTWTTLVLATGATATVDELPADTSWDLAFQRTAIRTNSGVSGVGGAGAFLADGQSWESITTARTWGYAVDVMVPVAGPPGSGETAGNPVLATWYDYDPATHSVAPKSAVWVLRGATGGAYKLRLNGWDNGTFWFQTAPLPRDLTASTVTIDASEKVVWQYFSFRLGAVVTGDAVAVGLDWDVALSGVNLRTNSGTSGAGQGGGAAGGADLATTTIPASVTVDEELPVPGPPGSGTVSSNAALGGWYDYDPVTHTVSPKAAAFVVKTADGGWAKLAITAYDGGTYTFDWVYAGLGEASF